MGPCVFPEIKGTFMETSAMLLHPCLQLSRDDGGDWDQPVPLNCHVSSLLDTENRPSWSQSSGLVIRHLWKHRLPGWLSQLKCSLCLIFCHARDCFGELRGEELGRSQHAALGPVVPPIHQLCLLGLLLGIWERWVQAGLVGGSPRGSPPALVGLNPRSW